MPSPDTAGLPRSQYLSLCAGLALLAVVTLPAAHAADPIGHVRNLDGSARIDGTAAQKDMAVTSGGVVETDANGRVAIVFRDDTRFTVGPDSKVTLDRFVFDPDAGAAGFVANVARGSFAYVSGQVAKLKPDGASVRTPVATIGIRGTHFAGTLGTVPGRVRDTGYPQPLWPPEAGAPRAAAGKTAATETQATFVLLPNPGDGKVGRISVANNLGTTELSADRDSATVAEGEPPRAAGRLSATDLDRLFGAVLKSAPPPAADVVRLYFDSGTAELTRAGRAAIANIVAEARRRNSTEIVVVGHTDTVASDAVNRELSRRRAEVVRDQLIAAGLPRERIRVEYHGYAFPFVPTAAGVAEPRNRRVEVTVR